MKALITTFESSEDGNESTVRLSTSIWETLLFQQRIQDSSTPVDEDRIFVSLKPTHSRAKHAQSISSLTCWAVQDDERTGASIPPTWPRIYKHIFQPPSETSSNTLLITLAQPIVLSEIILAASSEDAYAFGSTQQNSLEDALCGGNVVLRQGDMLRVQGHKFRLVMTLPVLQGVASPGKTSFLLIKSESSTLSGTGYTDGETSSAEEDEEEEAIEIEIGEEFLAGPKLEFSSPSLSSSSSGLQLNGANGSAHTGRDAGSGSSVSFQPRPLQTRLPGFEDDYTLGVRTADLGRVGLCSGDWALVHSPAYPAKQRLVRVVAADDVVPSPSVVTGSPSLLFNIHPKCITPSSAPILSSGADTYLALRPCQLPTIPTVRSVTIARVASAFSTDKKYQHLFLRELKRYFESEDTTDTGAAKRRLVKVGDVIGVGIDTDRARAPGQADDEDDEDTLVDSRTPPRTNATVFFMITNLEHDPIRTASGSSSNAGVEQDVSSAGECGCWIDTRKTKMVQTGVEHSFVPDVGMYLGMDSSSQQALYHNLLTLLRPTAPTPVLLSPRSPYHHLQAFISASLTPHAWSFSLPLTLLLKGARGSGKSTLVNWVAGALGMGVVEVDCYDLISNDGKDDGKGGESHEVKAEARLRVMFERAGECAPCVLLVRRMEALVGTTQPKPDGEGEDSRLGKALADCVADLQGNWKMTGYPTVVIGTTSEADKVPKGILTSFKHEVSIEAPSEKERYEMLHSLLAPYTLAPDASISYLATQTAALVAADLAHLVQQAHFASISRALKDSGAKQSDLACAGVPITASDFDTALSKARASYSESVGAPKIPNVSWDDVGGLAHVKADILDTIQLPLEHPELFADGLKKRSGILLYGPPGTGKTLLAKAVATSCSLNFFSVKGPELLNMYIGESEANVRRVFQRARDAKPCVIFFDELDSVAPKRGNAGDSGGVMDRIVSQLLAELDGMAGGGEKDEGKDGEGGGGGAEIFVMGATNRPDLLDPALLRPGRFDRLLYLGVSDTHKAQQSILEALTRKFRLDPALSLKGLAEQCPFNYTGADFYALCSDAMLNAMTRKAEEIEIVIGKINASPPSPNPHPHPLTPQYYLAEIATPEEMQVLVSKADFERALANLVPSVSEAEMEHYGRIQKKFSKDRAAVGSEGTEEGDP